MKTPIRRLDSLTHNDTAATKLINDNFEALQQGVEDALSRSGKKPNFMDDVLDMNMHRIINIADPVDDYDLANKHYVDTKVSEEETRAKAAEAEEEAARIAGDNALRRLIDDEKTARIAGDNALRGLIGAAGSESIYSRGATYVGTDTAEIDVSDIVEDGAAYVPIVTTAVGVENKEARKTLNSVCWYYKSTKKVQLLFTDNTYQSTNNIQYNVTLLGTVQSYTGDGTKGITDGLDDLCGSGGGADSAIHIEHMPATYVHTSTIDSAHIDVSSYVEAGKAYVPVVATEGPTSPGYFERISSLKGTCLYDIEHESVSLYFTNDYHKQVAACFSVTLIPVDYHPSHPDNKLCDGVTDGAGGMQNAENLVTSISGSSTDTQYPSAKCVYDIIGDVETLINAL